MLYFHYRREFGELIGQYVSGNFPRSRIDKASQTIFLSLNEKGAEFLSEADFGIVGEFGEEPEPPPTKPRRFIFNKPFLLILKEKTPKNRTSSAGWPTPNS